MSAANSLADHVTGVARLLLLIGECGGGAEGALTGAGVARHWRSHRLEWTPVSQTHEREGASKCAEGKSTNEVFIFCNGKKNAEEFFHRREHRLPADSAEVLQVARKEKGPLSARLSLLPHRCTSARLTGPFWPLRSTSVLALTTWRRLRLPDAFTATPPRAAAWLPLPARASLPAVSDLLPI